ncbi:MAG: polysaccharide pyruvyl transferase family protein [Deinococcota bacterium]
MTTAILGAFDRFNYGDLLFPLIADVALDQLGHHRELQAYGLKQSDLRLYQAKPTCSLYELAAQPNLTNLIIGGGEVLGTRWFNMHLHISEPPLTQLLKGTRKLAGLEPADQLSRFLLGKQDTPLPWLLPQDTFAHHVNIMYNAVGGSSNIRKLPETHRQYLVTTLEQAAFISVRDQDTHNVLAELGLPAQLAPDSAALMKHLVPALDDHISEPSRALTQEPYVCFQISKHHAHGRVGEIAAALDQLQQERKLNILLLPIGRAPAHEDHLALADIRGAMTTPALMPANDIGIADIMMLIAESEVFVGSSLHGAITAMAFAVAHLAFPEVAKVQRYLTTWDIPEQQISTSTETLLADVERVLSIDKTTREHLAERLEQASWGNFQAMVDVINASSS